MKKLTVFTIPALVLCLCLFANNVHAQQWVGSSIGGVAGVLYANPTSTSVAIGSTSASIYKLRVVGGSKRGIYASGSTYAGYFQGHLGLTGDIKAHENYGVFGLYANTSHSNGAYIKMYGKSASSRPGGMTICAYEQGDIAFFSRVSNTWSKHMTIYSTGKTAIGTDNTPASIGGVNINSYRLFVKGGILTEELRVRTGWADYVFDEGYELKSLSEVAAHIEEKGYLHNTPSAEQVEAEGIEVGEMTKNQQEKIEEVFLHLINLEKRIGQLESENIALKKALTEKE